MPKKKPNTPEQIRVLLDDIKDDPELNDGMREMGKRKAEFSSPMTAMLAGVGVVPEARAYFNERLDAMWAESALQPEWEEVIIGSGLTAAIYTAVRVANGFPRPLVLEAAGRAGGSFACSHGPTFWLNSRNRPGELSLPGERGALNVLPGAALQPADLSGEEYQSNDDLAFVIRATLAMNANVLTGQKVTKVEKGIGGYRVFLGPSRFLLADRVIDARGLGAPKDVLPDAPNVITFPEMMARMDGRFPLRGVRRAAVVGDGDSARTAIEALLGQGPSPHWSVASLDHVETIDWYGQKVPGNCEKFLETSRSRYRAIAPFLPQGSRRGRIVPRRQKGDVMQGHACGWVNERAYDLVVICTGFVKQEQIPVIPANLEVVTAPKLLGNGPVLATRWAGTEVYQAGPFAKITPAARERDSARIDAAPENEVALFRYAWRTAALAANLPKPPPIIAAPEPVNTLVDDLVNKYQSEILDLPRPSGLTSGIIS